MGILQTYEVKGYFNNFTILGNWPFIILTFFFSFLSSGTHPCGTPHSFPLFWILTSRYLGLSHFTSFTHLLPPHHTHPNSPLIFCHVFPLLPHSTSSLSLTQLSPSLSPLPVYPDTLISPFFLHEHRHHARCWRAPSPSPILPYPYTQIHSYHRSSLASTATTHVAGEPHHHHL